MSTTGSALATTLGTPNAEVASLFSGAVLAVDAEPMLVCEQLYPEERDYVQFAVAQRKAEFGTARVIAREALAELGIKAQALTRHTSRAPCWPDGIQGSISHTAGYCVVVVSGEPGIETLGVDAESRRTLQPDVMPLIFTACELSWLNTVAPELRDTLALVLFSAKEAIYKCQYPVTNRFLDFVDLELALDVETRTFVPSVLRGLGAVDVSKVERIRGRYLVTEQLVLTGATLSRNVAGADQA
jgi:enterobactin synthetase component D / holo-[acyl-carrier protein] synthase